jgi:ankyrin repeat protein
MTAHSGSSALLLAHMIERGDARGVSDALRADPLLIGARTADGDMPLHLACWHKQIEIVGVILAYGPDLAARGCYGRTPLHYAVHEGRPISVPIVGILLAMGADPSAVDDNGYSVEDWAKTEMSDGLAEVLDMIRRASGNRHG